MIHTYNCKLVNVAIDGQLVDGFAEDSVVTVSAKEDKVTSRTGIHGDIVRDISPNNQVVITLVVTPFSKINKVLENKYKLDHTNGQGMFPISVTYLNGYSIANASQAWVVKRPDRGFGKNAENIQYTIETGDVDTNITDLDN